MRNRCRLPNVLYTKFLVHILHFEGQPSIPSLPRVSKLAPELSGKNKTLTCTSAGHRESLYGQLRLKSPPRNPIKYNVWSKSVLYPLSFYRSYTKVGKSQASLVEWKVWLQRGRIDPKLSKGALELRHVSKFLTTWTEQKMLQLYKCVSQTFRRSPS